MTIKCSLEVQDVWFDGEVVLFLETFTTVQSRGYTHTHTQYYDVTPAGDCMSLLKSPYIVELLFLYLPARTLCGSKHAVAGMTVHAYMHTTTMHAGHAVFSKT